MKKLKIFLTLFILSYVIIGIRVIGYAQPKISKDDIPDNIPTDLRGIIERLYSSDPMIRGYAAVNLGKMGGRVVPAIPFLLGMLGDNASLVWTTGGPKLFYSTKANLLPGMDLPGMDRSTSPGEEAAKALAKIGEQTLDPLIAALRDSNYLVRMNAARGLGMLGNIKAIDPLIAALTDNEFAVRCNAVYALGEIKDPHAVGPLIAALKDHDDVIRANAAYALGKIKDLRALNPLITALKDGKIDVRKTAAYALGEIEDPHAVDPLIAALKDCSKVRMYAAEALKHITREDFGVDPDQWKKWWEQKQDYRDIDANRSKK